MADEPDNLVLEHLRHIRTSVDTMSDRLSQVEVRLTAIEGHLGNLVLSEAGRIWRSTSSGPGSSASSAVWS